MKALNILFISVCFLGLLASCKPKLSDDFTQKVLYLSKQQAGSTESEVRANKERLNPAILVSKKQADELEKKGLFYKKIAIKYLDIAFLRSTIQINLPNANQMVSGDNGNSQPQAAVASVPDEQELNSYQNALHYLLLSLEIFYGDADLYYNAGLCATYIGKYQKGKADASASMEWYTKARQYYNRAIELDANYTQALYSLAILLVFELHEPQEAITHLLHIKKREHNNTDARFLLGYTFFIIGEYKQALLEYEELEKLTKKPELIAQARKNRQQILHQLNQSQ